LAEVATASGLELVPDPGGAAFYGPKISVQAKDAIGRTRQMSTIQLDFNLPERFGLEYQAADGTRQRPVMIHRAPFGSMERFVAVLIEHTAGHFPLWLTPDQVVVLPISEKFNDYAHQVAAQLNAQDIRTQVDDRNERPGVMFADWELIGVPLRITVGDRGLKEGLLGLTARWVEGDGGREAMAALGSPEELDKYAHEAFESYYSTYSAPDFAAQVWTNNARIAAICVASSSTEMKS